MHKVATLLKIRPEETRMVVLMAALFLSLQAGQAIGENAAFALFLSRLDVDLLPYMYMGLGGVVFLASLAYATSLGRFQDSKVVVILLAGSVFLFILEWVAIVLFDISLYPVLWLTTFGMSVIFGTLLWTVAGEVCDARQAKRLFPLFTSMGILGSVAGNLLTGVFAKIVGTDNLIILYAALIVAGYFLTRQITRSYFRVEPFSNVKFNLINDLRAGFDFVRGSTLFRIIAYSSILYSVLFFTVDFPFSEVLAIEFAGDDASLAGFKGLFTSITTAVTFLVSLLIANRLYTRLGIISSILIMPITYVIGFIIFFMSFTFGGAVIARFMQLVVLGGIAGTAWNALFNVVPTEKRGQVLAFNNGVPAQIGVVLSGLMIILSKQILNTQTVLLLGACVAIATVYLTLRMKPAYGDALLSALRAGRTDVFSAEEEPFSGYQNDPAALEVVLKALQDSKAYTRRLAAEMLGKMGGVAALPALVERLSDADAEVRAAAIRSLTNIGADSVHGQILLGLDDPDDVVREETLASLQKLRVASSPELMRHLERLLDDDNIDICAHAAAVLLMFGDSKPAQDLLASLLKDEDVNKRRVALESYGRVVTSVQGRSSFDAGPIMHALNDSAPVVRREAIRVASRLPGESANARIVKYLSDVDATVRNIASESLKQNWPESRADVIHILEVTDEQTLDSALDSIPPGDVEMFSPLRGYIQREVSNIRYLRTLVDSLPLEGRAVALLTQTLKHREALSEERLIKAVGLFGNPRALGLIRKSLNAGDASTRAAALEALETLGDKKITQEVLPILDRGGVFQTSSDQKMDASQVVEILLSNEDYWLRALSARTVPELGLNDFAPTLHKLKFDPVLLVQQAANDALARMEDGATMKTLKTLSTLDRILLLREVPMFTRLSPQDLEQIAEIAQEQLYSDQAIICREGEPGNTLFIIVHGKVDVLKSIGKQDSVIATRGAGEFVGEMAIFESAPRSATLRAQGDVRVLVIDGSAFTAILLDRPEVAVSVLRHMSNRVRDLNQKVGVPLSG